ncbi:uncharacterized protein LOC130954432 [Arachis stenosperma]|uniref:uncharacterized protein LOC130954432 n=1 Tax=Arachis stenosperma TaxID=217475 RepID=UPI0025AC85E2|nr:uncharacterized protein LOC130954432 [Arachis stenosperma]
MLHPNKSEINHVDSASRNIILSAFLLKGKAASTSGSELLSLGLSKIVVASSRALFFVPRAMKRIDTAACRFRTGRRTTTCGRIRTNAKLEFLGMASQDRVHSAIKVRFMLEIDPFSGSCKN